MSAQSQKDRKAYYDWLEKTRKGNLDITSWIPWFLGSLRHAIHEAEMTVPNVLAKVHFWDRLSQFALNERQIKMLNQLLDAFEGKLTSFKRAKIADCSQNTAGRDIADMAELGLLKRGEGGGRKTYYEISLAGT